MNVVSYHLVEHTYTEESLLKIFSVNCLKSENLHWNEEEHEKHPLNKEIQKYDIVYSIQNIDNTNDEYGFLALNVNKQEYGNYRYTIEWVLIDDNLPITILNRFVESIIEQLTTAKRNCLEDTYRIDGVQTKTIYQISPIHNPSKQIATEIERCFISSKQGYLQLTEEEVNHYREIAKRMNASK